MTNLRSLVCFTLLLLLSSFAAPTKTSYPVKEIYIAEGTHNWSASLSNHGWTLLNIGGDKIIVRSPRGRIKEILLADLGESTKTMKLPKMVAKNINKAGHVVGNYGDMASSKWWCKKGFAWDIENGVILLDWKPNTIPTHINDRNEIVGYYIDKNEDVGFYRDRYGEYTDLKEAFMPFVAMQETWQLLEPAGFNNHRDFVYLISKEPTYEAAIALDEGELNLIIPKWDGENFILNEKGSIVFNRTEMFVMPAIFPPLYPEKPPVSHLLIWRPHSIEPEEITNADIVSAKASGMNDRDHIVGTARRADGQKILFLWTPNAGFVDLQLFASNHEIIDVHGIDNKGNVLITARSGNLFYLLLFNPKVS